MPWLGFAFPGGGSSGGGSTTTIAKPAASSSSAASTASASSAASSPVRVLRAEEVNDLQNENKQLRLLIQQLAEKAKQQQQTEAAAAASSSSSAYPSLSAGSSSPPATNPHASSSPESVSFQKVPGLAQRMMQSSSAASAPELGARRNSAAALSEAELAPVADFYSSLRASLSASKPAPSTISATRPHTTAAAAVAEEDEDEWGAAPSKSAPAPSSTDSVHAPRTDDEAIVRNKHSSVVVHKVRVARPDTGDDGSTTSTAVSAPVTGPASVDDFDDDFGDMSIGAAPASAASVAPADDGEEEIAIFDLSNAEWWTVVPHPDREDAPPLKAAESAPLDPQEDEDGFVVVRPKDSMAAVSDFISQMLKTHPEIDRLSPEELRAMLEGSLGELKEPSSIGKVWQMGKQAYYIYGWSSTAYSLYTDQTMLRIAAAGILKCAKWSCVFLL